MHRTQSNTYDRAKDEANLTAARKGPDHYAAGSPPERDVLMQ